MCNNYQIEPNFVRMAAEFLALLDLRLELPAGAEDGTANLTFRTDVYPGYQSVFARPVDPKAPDRLELAVGRWGLVPWYFKKPLKEWKAATNNARSETMHESAAFRDAVKAKRCIIPVTHFCEHTGPKGAKTKHRITHAPGGLLFMAGLWARAELPDGPLESYSMVMQAALEGDDMHRFHTRQPVILDRDSARTWLDLEADYAPILKARPAGTLAFDPPEPAAA